MTVTRAHAPSEAAALQRRSQWLAPDQRPSDTILQSWARSFDAGLDPGRMPPQRIDDGPMLAWRRERSDRLRALAHAELATLMQQIAGSNFLLAFADPDGVILDLVADNRFATSSSGQPIAVGSHWSEGVAGTNGLGTALASGASAAVSGPEHFFTRLADITCTAAPIRDPQGTLVGVLDASSYFHSRQQRPSWLYSGRRRAQCTLSSVEVSRKER